ncbi:tyrosine-type recombinase/integrase [Pseudomonas sp. LB3P58]
MKRSEIKRRPLSRTVIDALEPEDKEYRENYGGAERLHIVVSPSGRKRWELRYKKSDGKWGWHGLGSYRDVNIEQAREKAQQSLRLLASGTDPVLHRAQKKSELSEAIKNSFESIAEAWYAKKSADGRAEKTLKSMKYALDNDMLPALGKLPISSITRKHCAELQNSIELRQAHNTAKKVRSWLNQIFGYAIANGKCENNPASNLLDIASVQPPEKQYPHLLEHQLPDFLKALEASPSRILVKSAAWLTIYTASRPGMVRKAEWAEFDINKKIWCIPDSKMKMGREHLVPLSSQVISILNHLKNITGKSKYLFPSEGSKSLVMSDNTVNKCFAGAGYKDRMTGHGSRHTATTLLSEHGWPENWVEMQLAHKKPGLREVYDKATHLKNREIMMQWYCDYLDALKEGLTPNQKSDFKRRAARSKNK